jgi:hypothetical protein
MPKKPRQSHIPKQVTRRKARRPNVPAAVIEPAYAPEEAAYVEVDGSVVHTPAPVATAAEPRRRRLELVRQSREAMPLRSLPGQLPTYDRAYLVSELRTIGVITTALLALIIVLAIVLR